MVSLKHKFNNAHADGADTTVVRPSNWNDEHDLMLSTTGVVIGRKSAGSGAAEELSSADLVALIGSSTWQPLDSDLTAIAGLTPLNDDIIQRKAGSWVNRTMANLIADLAALGTTFQPLAAALTSWAGITRATGFDTFAATPSSANLAALLTDETGTGANVFAGSPALTGTPTLAGGTSGTTGLQASAVASGTLTLPAATDTLIGKATTDTLTNKTLDTAGVGNVLKINGTQVSAVTGTGSVVLATSPTLVTPALGTPASGTLTNATGLPISTGVSGLGTGVATALGTAVGSAGSPVVNGGVLGTPSSGDVSNCTAFTGDSGTGGIKGVVPAPGAGDAAASKFLKADGTWAAPSGSGYVTGPASSTDTAIARFNGTTGKIIENSGVTIDASNIASGFAGLSASGTPSFSFTPLGQGSAQLAVIKGAFTTASSTTQEIGASFTLDSSHGTGSSAKVALYSAAMAEANSGNIYGANTFVGLASGAPAGVIGIGYEIDVFNAKATAIATPALGSGLANYGLVITGTGTGTAGAFLNTAGLWFTTGSGNVFSQGISFTGGTSNSDCPVKNESFYDGSYATTSIKIAGTHSYGIDLTAGTLTVPIRTKNSGYYQTLNNAGSAHIPLIGANTSDNIIIGLSAANGVYTGGTVLGPLTTDGAALGSTSLMWSDLFLASGAVVNFNNGNVTVTHSAGALASTGVLTSASATAPPASGSATCGVKWSSTSNLGIYSGTGAPTFSAAKGSLYTNTTATTTTTRLYINSDGGTTWVTFTASA